MSRDAEAGGPLRFTVFGPVRAWRGSAQLDLGPARRRAVLAALLLHANRPVGREQLIEAVWGDPAPAFAVNQLQKYVSALRRTLEPDREARAPSGVLTWSEGGYVLRVEGDGLDLAVFESLAAAGREALAAGNAPQAAADLEKALGMWSGRALENVSSTFLDGERDRLAELRTAVLQERIEADLRLGRHNRLVPELTQLVAEFPLHERFASLLMLALFRSGRQAEALAVYETARSVLVEELGIDPGPELQQRRQQILTNDAALTLDTADGAVRDAQVQVTALRDAPEEPVRAGERGTADERGTVNELALRLDDARKMQIKAGNEARAAYGMVFWLLAMVNSLQERVDRLEAEKQAHEPATAPSPVLQRELVASHERLSAARRQLVLARREREKAEEIQLATQRLVEERLHERDADLHPPADAAEDGGRFSGAERLGLVPLYEVDHLLEASEARLRKQAAELDELESRLLRPGPAEEPRTGAEPQVIRGEFAAHATVDAAADAAAGDTGVSGSTDRGALKDRSHAASSEDDGRPGGRPDAHGRAVASAAGRAETDKEWGWKASSALLAGLLAYFIYLFAGSQGGTVSPVYKSGDRPQVVMKPVIPEPRRDFSPPQRKTAFTWPATNTSISTTFTPDALAWPRRSGDPERLTGYLSVSLAERAQRCPGNTRIVWTVAADDRPVAADVLIPEEDENAEVLLETELPPKARSVTITVANDPDRGVRPCAFKATVDRLRIRLSPATTAEAEGRRRPGDAPLPLLGGDVN